MSDYLIKKGDTLGGLAKQHNTTVADIQAKNPSITNPDLIYAGRTLELPTPDSIKTQPSLTLPETKTDVKTTGMRTMVDELQTQNKAREEAFQASQKDLKDSMQNLQDFPERAGEIREEEGVNTFRRGVDEIDALIASRSRALDRQIELLESQPISGSMATRQQQKIQREATRELADLSLIQNARSGRLETAQAIASERIELELMPYEQQLEFDKFFYEENRDFLTDSEDKAFKLRIANEEREYAEERERVTQVTDLMLAVAELGASPTLIKQIANAETLEEAIGYASGVFGEEIARQAVSGRTESGSDPTGSDESGMSINQIEQFRRSYGWTPPAGVTWDEVVEFMEANPGLTPEEYKALADKMMAGEGSQVNEESFFTLSPYEQIMTYARNMEGRGKGAAQIKAEILELYKLKELHQIAKDNGIASRTTRAKVDVDRMLNSMIAGTKQSWIDKTLFSPFQ